jgi:hypothetical protein
MLCATLWLIVTFHFLGLTGMVLAVYVLARALNQKSLPRPTDRKEKEQTSGWPPIIQDVDQ